MTIRQIKFPPKFLTLRYLIFLLHFCASSRKTIFKYKSPFSRFSRSHLAKFKIFSSFFTYFPIKGGAIFAIFRGTKFSRISGYPRKLSLRYILPLRVILGTRITISFLESYSVLFLFHILVNDVSKTGFNLLFLGIWNSFR